MSLKHYVRTRQFYQKKTLAVPLAKVFLAFAQKEREIFSFVKSLVVL